MLSLSGFLFSFIFILAVSINATTISVPSDFGTIQESINASALGDTVLVAPGSYFESLDFLGKAIVVKSSDGPLVTTITNDANVDLLLFTNNETPTSVIEGFTFDGGKIAILCENASPTIKYNILKNQNITNWGAISLGGDSYATEGNSPAVIYNNTIVNSANGGISTYSTVSPIIKNNIIANNLHYGIHRHGGGVNVAQPELSYNNFFGNPINYQEIADTGIGTISEDALFNGNYSLDSLSPCIDAGDPAPEYNDPNGTVNDMGSVPFVVVESAFINLVQWTIADGGNDHWYAIVPEVKPWVNHRDLALTFNHNGQPGYLVTVTSVEENQFIYDNLLVGNTDQPSIADEFYLGGYGSPDWHWLNNEPMSYTNWATNEPNGDGFAIAIWGASTALAGLWNDVPEDTTGLGDIHQLWSIIEFGQPSVGGGDSLVIHVPADYGSIQEAINASVSGDTVLVAPGIYFESLDFIGKAIVVKSSDGPLVTIITNDDATNLVIFTNGEVNTTVLEGFTLKGGYIGVLCENASPTIRHNLFKNQNIPNWGAISLGGDGYATSGNSPAVITNNTIVYCANGGISTFSLNPPIIKNNIIAFNSGFAIHREGLLTGIAQPVLSYNNMFGNTTNYQEIADSGIGTISIDPLFNTDNSLSEFSPCIDTGDPDPLYNDFDGSRNDMGGIEYDSSHVPVNPSTIYVPADYITIQGAIVAANNTDTIIVSPGVYFESLDFMGKSITVKSSDGPITTTITNAPDVNLVTFTNNENSASVIEGFTFDGGRIAVLCENAGPTIRFNLLKNQNIPDWGAISLGGNDYATEGNSPAVIYNNTIVNCANGGISTFSTVSPIIKNNIIANNFHYAIHRQGSGTVAQPELSYNNMFGNSINYQEIADTGIGTISEDPVFNVNYTLSALSPCIDAGDPDQFYNDPDGSQNDMGAKPFNANDNPIINLVQWTMAEGGNDHWYAIIPEVRPWVGHRDLAESYALNGVPGYLATVSSVEENQFIHDNLLVGNTNQPSVNDQFFLGGGFVDGSWAWNTGEPFVYSNWAVGEPNGDGIAMAIWGASTGLAAQWNDVPDDTLPPNSANNQLWSLVEFSDISNGGGSTVSGTITLDNVIGSPNLGEIYAESPISFQIRVNNNTGQDVRGITNGFRVYSPDGAEWTTTIGDTIGSIGYAMFDLVYAINHFSATGSGADSVLFGGASLSSSGMPAGFSEVAYSISIGPINSSYVGQTICLDSSFTPPAGAWRWDSNTSQYTPAWDGPHCFTIIPATSTSLVDSLLIPSMDVSYGVNTLTVASKLTQPISGATIPITIPANMEIVELNTTGLITDNWDYNILQVKPDSGFIFVLLANSSGLEIPVGRTDLFNIKFTGVNSFCGQSLVVHLDTTKSNDISRRLTFANMSSLPVQVGFDKNRDSLTFPELITGDFNNDGSLDIGDLVALVDYMFRGGIEPVHFNAVDINGDCQGPDIADLVRLIDYMFVSNEELPCGCVETTNKISMNYNNKIDIYSVFENGITSVYVNTPISLKGIEVSISNESNAILDKFAQMNFEFYYHTEDIVTRAGLFDMRGSNSIQSGKTGLFSIEGDCQILSAVVADENANSIIPTVNNKLTSLPDNYRLLQNYPNPFNPTTTISYWLPEGTNVNISVYNINGQKIATLSQGFQEAGEYSVLWQGADYSSGIYLYRLETDSFIETKKMMLLK